MLGSSSPAAPSLSTNNDSATPTSPTRSSRLRGLSYLRSYTHSHLHSNSSNQPSSPSSSRTTAPPLQRSTSFPTRNRSQSKRVETATASPSPRRANNTSNSGSETPTDGWVPTVGGQSGLSRVAPQPQPTATDSSTSTEPQQAAIMTRSRAATVGDPESLRAPTTPAASSEVISAETTAPAPVEKKEQMPSIRFIPHHEPRATRPSLSFPIISRTLPTHDTKVKVGRYSERDNNAADVMSNPLSTGPVGFKSKVVSRRHCELWCQNGQWFVKDVKSSSGTFLNHVRLSSPGMESRPYPVNDGDIIQLGIDFKGGEEVIFRCVKIRVECNRGWQKSLNQFNTQTHKQLLKRAQGGAKKDSDAQSTHSSECSICLNPVAPCQALFVAPCSHVWHYKCIRTLIYPSWPSFQCPNCRAYADLEADVEQPEDDDNEEEVEEAIKESQDQSRETRKTDSTEVADASTAEEEDLTIMLNSTTLRSSSASPQPPADSGSDAETGPSAPLPILGSTGASLNGTLPESIMARSATPTSTTQFALAAGVLADGPMTPMNDVGPFLFESGTGRRTRNVDDMAREPVHEEADE